MNPAAPNRETRQQHAGPDGVCDTGEPLPVCLEQSLKDFFTFVEFHWFLLTSLLPPSLRPDDAGHFHCHCCNPSTTRRSKKTVSDIFTWALCFNRYATAQCPIYPEMLPQMMAYENTIIQAHLQFIGEGWHIYDHAFRIQAASRRTCTTEWQGVDTSLYTSSVACQPCWSSVCQFCCSSGHRSSTCPWEVNDPASLDIGPPCLNATTTLGATPYSRPICNSWNAGSCRYPGSCHYRHVCSSCAAPGHCLVSGGTVVFLLD